MKIISLIIVALILNGCVGWGGGTVWERDDSGQFRETLKYKAFIAGLAAPKVSFRMPSGATMAAEKADALQEVTSIVRDGITAGIKVLERER